MRPQSFMYNLHNLRLYSRRLRTTIGMVPHLWHLFPSDDEKPNQQLPGLRYPITNGVVTRRRRDRMHENRYVFYELCVRRLRNLPR